MEATSVEMSKERQNQNVKRHDENVRQQNQAEMGIIVALMGASISNLCRVA
jgi:hypothetical protein